jgi:hypothetical protein
MNGTFPLLKPVFPMNTHRLFFLSAMVFLGLVVPLSRVQGQLPTKLDFSDTKSSTLTGKAWAAWAAKDYDAVIGYSQKCIDMYKDQAVAMQNALTTLPPKATASTQWALNDVGISYYLLGMAYQAQSKKPEAAAAYNFVINSLSFAQCFDPKGAGVYWKVADAAKGKLKEVIVH